MEIFTLVLGYCATNTYVIIENGEAVVVDPADDGEYISRFVEQKQAVIKSVLVTHGHFDHIKAVRSLQKLGATVYMTKTDYDCVNFGDPDDVFGAPNDRFELDGEVADGDKLTLSGHTYEVIETAGHTAGGVCYVLDDEIVFSGDTLFALGIGRTDFPHGDYSALVASVRRLYALPHDYKILPGHGGATTLYCEKRNNPYVRC